MKKKIIRFIILLVLTAILWYILFANREHAEGWTRFMYMAIILFSMSVLFSSAEYLYALYIEEKKHEHKI